MGSFEIRSVMSKRIPKEPPEECCSLPDIPPGVVRREPFSKPNAPGGRRNFFFDREKIREPVRCKVRCDRSSRSVASHFASKFSGMRRHAQR